MKGFIEVTEDSCQQKDLISTCSILRVLNTSPVLIVTKELISKYECSNDNLNIYVRESYEEIKELIKQAQ